MYYDLSKQHRQNESAGQVDVSKQHRQNETAGQVDIPTRVEICVMG